MDLLFDAFKEELQNYFDFVSKYNVGQFCSEDMKQLYYDNYVSRFNSMGCLIKSYSLLACNDVDNIALVESEVDNLISDYSCKLYKIILG